MTLEIIWFILLFVLLIGYAVMDGFDLGVGILHLLNKDDHERRVALNAIGPVWDGNEVWLLTGGGALFAAFPPVYATVFSGFYLALMLLLVALIGRAVALEFRSKVESTSWRNVWDWAFFLGSALPALLLGVAFGNILRGVPITSSGDWAGSFFGLLNPFSVVVGLLAVAACTLHGAIYLAGKSEGAMSDRLVRMVQPLWSVFALLYIVATAWAFFASPHLFEHSLKSPLTWALMVVALVGLVSIVPMVKKGNFATGLVASGATIGAVVALAATGLFPRLVPSSIDLAYSLTTDNSSSSPLTLKSMLIIALIGMPMVLLYTALVHRVFKGKVTLNEDSY